MTDLSRTWMIKLSYKISFSRVDNIHFQQLCCLPIEIKLVLQKVRLVYKVINDRALVYFNSDFSRVNVRQSIIDINLCRYRTLNGQMSLNIQVQMN